MSEEYTMNKEIKPCMNDGCVDNDIGYGSGCIRYTEPWNPLGCRCPKYSDTPPPKPFTPKKPDDYIIGCKDFSPSRAKCHVCDAPNDLLDCEFHAYLCECVPCYDPAPKPVPPKTRKIHTIEIPDDIGGGFTVSLEPGKTPTIQACIGSMYLKQSTRTEEIDNEN